MARPKPDPIANDASKRYQRWLDRRLGEALNDQSLDELVAELRASITTLTSSVAALGLMEPYEISGVTHTVSSTDIRRYGRTTNGGDCTVTVNTSHGFETGDVAHYRQAGGGQIIFDADGTTINTSETFKSRKEGANVMLICVNATTHVFDLTGDLEIL